MLFASIGRCLEKLSPSKNRQYRKRLRSASPEGMAADIQAVRDRRDRVSAQPGSPSPAPRRNDSSRFRSPLKRRHSLGLEKGESPTPGLFNPKPSQNDLPAPKRKTLAIGEPVTIPKASKSDEDGSNAASKSKQVVSKALSNQRLFARTLQWLQGVEAVDPESMKPEMDLDNSSDPGVPASEVFDPARPLRAIAPEPSTPRRGERLRPHSMRDWTFMDEDDDDVYKLTPTRAPTSKTAARLKGCVALLHAKMDQLSLTGNAKNANDTKCAKNAKDTKSARKTGEASNASNINNNSDASDAHDANDVSPSQMLIEEIRVNQTRLKQTTPDPFTPVPAKTRVQAPKTPEDVSMVDVFTPDSSHRNSTAPTPPWRDWRDINAAQAPRTPNGSADGN